SATHSLISSFLSFTSFLPLMRPLPPSSTLFPYTTLFRSADDLRHRRGDVLTHIGLAAGHGNQAIRRDRIPDAGLEARRCRCGERAIGEAGIAKHEAGRGGADQEGADRKSVV